MTSHEIKPKQLRALLLLLVLVPLIPTVLMIRFVIDAVQSERAAALERTSAVLQQTLLRSDSSLKKHLAQKGGRTTPEEVHAFYRELFDREVDVSVLDQHGQRLAGSPLREGAPVAQTSLRELSLPWLVQARLADQTALKLGVKEQIKAYAWTVVIAVVAVFSIAIAAAVAVSRQLALQELKTTSVATVAHELRTPLASMRMLVDTLREGRCRDETQRREYLDLIAAENVRLSHLTDNFLTLSRLEHRQHDLTLDPVAPRALAEQAVQSVRSRLEAPEVQFSFEAREPLPQIRADREAMVTVLINLLDNALKYTGAKKRIGLSLSHDRGAVHFSVSDDGIGLSRAERRIIFEPFQQVDRKLSRAREGCGLGLSIVKHIVTAHHGHITVTSESGKGSVFTVMIPAESDAGRDGGRDRRSAMRNSAHEKS